MREMHNIGETVFDMPSQSLVRVIAAERHVINPGETVMMYLVDAPIDPTGDGAFPTGWRNDYEICSADKRLPLDY
jgi:hypothetical protein